MTTATAGAQPTGSLSQKPSGFNVICHGTFATEKEAIAARDAYINRYHPDGYGTSTSISQASNGLWVVSGVRHASCE